VDWNQMRLSRLGLVLTPALLLSLPGAAAARVADDTPEEIAKELAEKIAKAMKKAEEAQRKAAEKAAKRAREEREDRTEAQQEAREKAAKERREASRRAAHAGKDVAKLEEEALDEMEDRVESYVKKVHKKAAKDVPDLPAQATPEQITAYQRALADRIRALRPQARQGDLFAPESQPIVKRIIAAELAGRAGAPARKEILNGNPPIDPDHDDRMKVKLAVNAPYPPAAPLSNVPPSVLLTLPLLPKEVEYRFVNRDLVLRDVGANMILDFITGAAPPLTTTSTRRR
jgi:flagellar motor protein MotB